MSLEIDDEKLVEWIKDAFDKYKSYRNDYLVCSPFKEDRKFKLSISPTLQCYHCWKTEESGPLWKLVCEIDQCSKQEALERIYTQNSIEDFERQLDKLKQYKTTRLSKQPSTQGNISKLPDFFKLITLEHSNEINNTARNYLTRRRINPIKWKMGYCYKGKYYGHIILPILDQDGNCIYWIARSLYGQKPKYLNPPADLFEVDKSCVLFSENWQFDDRDIFITEGVFDAIALIELGFNAIAIFGKMLSHVQIDIIKKAQNIILAFDSDKPGQTAIKNNMRILNEFGIVKPKFIVPPIENSDWSKIYEQCWPNTQETKDYILNNQKVFDLLALLKLKLKSKNL